MPAKHAALFLHARVNLQASAINLPFQQDPISPLISPDLQAAKGQLPLPRRGQAITAATRNRVILDVER